MNNNTDQINESVNINLGELDGMAAYMDAIHNPNPIDPNWPLPSFDARDWAQAFCKTASNLGHEGIDEAWMVGWFANALMRGFDEAQMRAAKEKLND
jgi:hypothetical protein